MSQHLEGLMNGVGQRGGHVDRLVEMWIHGHYTFFWSVSCSIMSTLELFLGVLVSLQKPLGQSAFGVEVFSVLVLALLHRVPS